MLKNSMYAIVCVMLIIAGCGSRQTIKMGNQNETKKDQIVFSGGAGDSYETAIIIKQPQGIRKQEDAVAAEYDFISGLYGKKDKEWKVEEQSMVKENGKTYDMVRVQILVNGKLHFFYFDISSFIRTAKQQQAREEN